MNKSHKNAWEAESSFLILISPPCRILLPPYQYFRKERETLCSCRGNLEGLKIYPVLSKAFSRCWDHLITGGWPAQPPFPMAETAVEVLGILLSGPISNSSQSGSHTLPWTAKIIKSRMEKWHFFLLVSFTWWGNRVKQVLSGFEFGSIIKRAD